MNSSTSEQSKAERSDRAVLCSKCEHLNTWGRNECKKCGSRLYISCADCGHKNERVRTRCTNCTRRLHHSPLERMVRKIRGGTSELTGLQIVVFCAGVGIAFLIILFFATIDLPHLF